MSIVVQMYVQYFGLFFASEMSISFEALHFYFRKGGYSEMFFYSQISTLPSILIVHLQIKVTTLK
jgi:hypothetical protein